MNRILVILSKFIFWSCEAVIEVDAPGEDPRLIIDAMMRIDMLEENFALDYFALVQEYKQIFTFE